MWHAVCPYAICNVIRCCAVGIPCIPLNHGIRCTVRNALTHSNTEYIFSKWKISALNGLQIDDGRAAFTLVSGPWCTANGIVFNLGYDFIVWLVRFQIRQFALEIFPIFGIANGAANTHFGRRYFGRDSVTIHLSRLNIIIDFMVLMFAMQSHVRMSVARCV